MKRFDGAAAYESIDNIYLWRPDKRGDKNIGRSVINLFNGPDLSDFTLVNNNQPVSHC